MPPPVKAHCEQQNWSLFRFVVIDHDHLTMHPVLQGDTKEFHASLEPDGRLWIPAAMREAVALGDQSVMLRVEAGAIQMYIRKVFETLSLGPGRP